jgi:hypothetical protein
VANNSTVCPLRICKKWDNSIFKNKQNTWGYTSLLKSFVTRKMELHSCFSCKIDVLLLVTFLQIEGDIYRVIRKSLWDVRPLRYSSRDGHAEGDHVNRGRDTPSFCPTLQVLDMSFLLCLSWLLRSRVRKFRRDLSITLYNYGEIQSLKSPPPPGHHMSLMDFVVSPPGCGRSVTDF